VRYLLLILSQLFISRALAIDADSLKFKDHHLLKIAGYPSIGYAPETSMQFGGVGIFLLNSISEDPVKYHRPASITPFFLFTLKGQFLSSIKTEFFPKGKKYINVNVRYFNYPDSYFGTGNNTTGKPEKFTDEYFKVDGKMAWIMDQHSFAGISFEWAHDHLFGFQNGGILETGKITGSNGGNILGIGPVLRYDTRDNILYPSRGLYIETSGLFYPGNDYSFSIFQADARYFKTVFSEKNIIALQANINFAQGRKIPFYKLPRLGGESRLRGIEHENKYRDHNAYYVQFEVRRELFWRLGGVLFAGVGNVSQDFSISLFNNLKWVYGIGGRYQPFKNEKLNLRLDIGKGPDTQYAIYFSVREAF
jgi:hypothetical protein